MTTQQIEDKIRSIYGQNDMQLLELLLQYKLSVCKDMVSKNELSLKDGGTYRNRQGDIVTVKIRAFYTGPFQFESNRYSYKSNGRVLLSEVDHPKDLIEEVE